MHLGPAPTVRKPADADGPASDRLAHVMFPSEYIVDQ